MSPRLTKTRQKLSLFKFEHSHQSLAKEILVDASEIFCQPLNSRVPGCFLGVVAQADLESLLKRRRVLPGLKARGFENLTWQVDTKDPYEHTLRIYCGHTGQDHLLIELVLHKTAVVLSPHNETGRFAGKSDVLFVEWLQLQNPLRDFDVNRPRLPGQRHPGLGLANEVLDFLVDLCKRCGLSGVVAVPGHFHNAVIFSKSFKYLNTGCEGKLQALQRDLKDYPLAMVSWAIELNCVQNVLSGDYLSWFVDWQVLGTSGNLRKYFAASDYREKVSEVSLENRFQLDEAKFAGEKEKIPRLAEVII
ncbi:MAG TPA: hypothetical protein VGA99_06680 [bacterium]